MNIPLYLVHKEKTAYLYETDTIKIALDKMSFYRYSEVPVINKEGIYIGSLREGDILWYVREQKKFNLKAAEKTPIKDLKRYRSAKPIQIDANIEELFELVLVQNFVPVLDGRNLFIGIVTRKDIMQYLIKQRKDN